MIWGTDVNVQDTKKQFVTFLRGFVDDIHSEEDDDLTVDSTEPLYLQRLEEVNNYSPTLLFISYLRSTHWKNHSLMSSVII